MSLTEARLTESGGMRGLEVGANRVLEDYVEGGPIGVLFTDDFNRTDGDAGANWVSVFGGEPWIRSGHLQSEFDYAESQHVTAVAANTSIMFAEATVTTPTSQHFRGIGCCATATTGGYVLRRFTYGGAFDLTRNDGYCTSFAGDAIGTFTFRVEIEDNGDSTVDVVCYKDAVELGRWTDSSPLTGKLGIAKFEPYTTGCYLDNWSHGDVVPAEWSPADLPGLVGWWDASDAASLAYHSGVIVSQWSDLSGAANHMVQATSTNAPVLDSATFDLPVVRFTQFPNLTWLQRTASNIIGGNDLTILGTIWQETTGSARVIGMRTSGGSDFSGSAGGALGSEGGTFPHGYRGGAIANSGTFPNEFDVYGWRFDGTNSYVYVGSTEYGPVANSGTFDVDEVRLGGAPQGGEGSWCYIGELVIYDRSLTSGERTDVIDYLTAKWL